MNNLAPCLYHSLVNHLQLFFTPTFLLKVHLKSISDHINAKSGVFSVFILLDLSMTINARKFTFFHVFMGTYDWVTLGQCQHGITSKRNRPQNLRKIMNLFTLHRNLLRRSKGTITEVQQTLCKFPLSISLPQPSYN